MEMKNVALIRERERKRVGMEFGVHLKPRGISRALALWWKRKVNMTLLHQSIVYIDKTVKIVDTNEVIHITWVFGDADFERRKLN